MKNHRHLKNSPLLKFSVFAVLALCLIPMLPSLATPHGAGAMALAGLPMIGGMRIMEKETEPGADAVSIGDAIKAVEDPTMTMSQRIGVALKALKGIDPTNQLATIQQKLTDTEASLVTVRGENATLQAEITNLKAQITALQTDVTQADTARAAAEKTAADLTAKEQDLQKRTEAATKEKMASLGFPSAKLPKQDPKQTTEDDKLNSPEAKIRRLSGQDRIMAADHFRKHKALPDWVDAKLADLAVNN